MVTPSLPTPSSGSAVSRPYGMDTSIHDLAVSVIPLADSKALFLSKKTLSQMLSRPDMAKLVSPTYLLAHPLAGTIPNEL